MAVGLTQPGLPLVSAGPDPDELIIDPRIVVRLSPYEKGDSLTLINFVARIGKPRHCVRCDEVRLPSGGRKEPVVSTRREIQGQGKNGGRHHVTVSPPHNIVLW